MAFNFKISGLFTSILVAVSSVQAFVLPPICRMEDGQIANITLVSSATTLLPPRPPTSLEVTAKTSDLARRSFPSTEIGCRFDEAPLDYNNLFAATVMEYNWCDAGGRVKQGTHQAFRSGNVITFICSYNGANPCSSVEAGDAWDAWSQACPGGFYPAYLYIKEWNKTYGRDLVTTNICTNGAGGVN
ncbi:hypothetical protein C8J57DRAFT_1298190 [Mycena rebaudengoi]|nr:hypothetical protein C8J57DRAFT_1298190 [Mycena rebaudengoi]